MPYTVDSWSRTGALRWCCSDDDDGDGVTCPHLKSGAQDPSGSQPHHPVSMGSPSRGWVFVQSTGFLCIQLPATVGHGENVKPAGLWETNDPLP